MKHSSLFNFTLFAAIAFSAVACNKDSGSQKTAPEDASFDKKVMLKSIADRAIMPSVVASASSSERLRSALIAFQTSPSQASLAKARESFFETLDFWKQAEGFNVGVVQGQYLKTKIESVPVNGAFIEGFITSDDELNEAFIESKGSSSKGLRAIEYLLFDPEKEDAMVLAAFTDDKLGSRRLAYLSSCGENLHQKLTELESVWTGTEDYYTEFINDDGAYVTSSLSMLVNEVTALLEKMSLTKLGKPLGKNNGGAVNASLLESHLSGHSAEDLKNNLKAIKAAYFGGLESDSDAVGMDDYLAQLRVNNTDAPLTGRIKAQFILCESSLNALEAPLHKSIEATPQAAEVAYKELKNLLVLFKTELASQMGVTITFSDNDGD